MVNIVFIHPDLGIGGAEKSMVDAALALKSNGHNVEFITSYHNTDHCFDETKDGTFNVTVSGNWLPRHFLGKFNAFFAYLRMIYAAFYLVFFHPHPFDLVMCDQISACIPVLRLSHKPIVFYCHFPDTLLTQKKTFLKRLYRYPIDWLEEVTTGQADKILVNSNFTAGVVKETFQSLSKTELEVLYPIPNFKPLDNPAGELDAEWNIPKVDTLFLSINRYSRSKNLPLALHALGMLQDNLGDLTGKVHLVIAGGYDDRVIENVEHYLELRKLAADLKLDNLVTFLCSVSDDDKLALLSAATCLLYTPDREHFGIVPVEAMYLRCPVIAVNSGGPLETVDHEVTGYLCEQTGDAFSKAMNSFVENPDLKTSMGKAGRARMINLFSFETYSRGLNRVVDALTTK